MDVVKSTGCGLVYGILYATHRFNIDSCYYNVVLHLADFVTSFDF